MKEQQPLNIINDGSPITITSYFLPQKTGERVVLGIQVGFGLFVGVSIGFGVLIHVGRFLRWAGIW